MRVSRQTLVGAAATLVGLLGACASSSESVRNDKRIWDERSPYGFHRSVATALLRTGQAARAVPHIQKLLRLRDDSAEPQVLMARASIAMKLYRQAEKHLDRALALEPKYAAAHSARGMLLDKLQRHHEAEKAHRRAIKLDASDAGFHNNLGFCLYLQGRFGDAVRAYGQALERDPGLRRIHNNLGFAYAGAGNPQRAFRHFQLAGQTAQANNNMGFAYESRGELTRAYNFYLKAAKEDPALTSARENLARVCKLLGRDLPDLPDPTPAVAAPESKGS